MDDLGPYISYKVTINGKEFELRARGWYYTHAVATFENGRWCVNSWHGAKVGQPSEGQERAEQRAAKAPYRYGAKVVVIGQSYSFDRPEL